MDWEFGNYRLERTSRLLVGPEGSTELSAPSFDILDMLLSKAEDVVSKAELFDTVWPGRIVEENTLQVHISALRKVLPAGMIMTVHGRGYKFAGPMPFASAKAFEEKRRPSIAVLPFDNMSGDPEQDYFSDGITEDIIAELSKFKEFLVIARNSSFQFRGKANDLSEVARKLNVQYVVEGSVRKIANRVRVSAQLIDTSSIAHVWAEHYDRDLNDIFAIQDEITQMVTARLARQTRTAIAFRSRGRPTGNISAYESYLRALHLASQYDTVTQAEPFLQKAVVLDPEFAGARAMLGFVESIKYYWSYDHGHLESGLKTARAALQLDPEEAYGHLASGFALMYMRRFREAEPSLDRAVALNPNDPFILSIRALFLSFVGRTEAALVELEQAQKRDPFAVGWFEDFHGIILTGAGRYRDALASFVKMETVPAWTLVYMTICHAELGELRQAESLLARIKTSYPQFPGITLDGILKEEIFYGDPVILDRFSTILQRIDKRLVT
jgi:TolB-like protein